MKYFYNRLLKILLAVLPDEFFIRLKYFLVFKRSLQLDHPTTLNEKINASKLYDRNPLYTVLADKYEVRRFVEKKIGHEHLIPLLAVYDSPYDLPEGCEFEPPFIIKPNHDSGGGVIVREREIYDRNDIIEALAPRLKRNFYRQNREWEYKNIKRRVIVERLLLDEYGKLPNDFKFNCFGGRCEFVYCSLDREGRNYRRIYSREWAPIGMSWCAPGMEAVKFVGPPLEKPANFGHMLALAEKLAQGMSYVRVDLYSTGSQVFFGEYTFHHGGGFEMIIPEELDYKYGRLMDISHFSNSRFRR